MPNLLYDIFSVVASSGIFAIMFLVLYAIEKKKYLLYWSLSWLLLAGVLVIRLLGELGIELSYGSVLSTTMNYFNGYFLLIGSMRFIRGKSPRKLSYALLVAYALILTLHADPNNADIISYIVFLVVSVLFIYTGASLYMHTRLFSKGGKMAGAALIVWGLHKAEYPFVSDLKWFLPIGYQIAVILIILTALGIFLLHFEKAKYEHAQREEFYKNIAEASKDIVFFVDFLPETELKYISTSVEKVTGFSQTEVMGSDHLQNMIILDYIKKIQGVNRRFTNPENQHIHEIVSKAGKKLVLEFSYKSHHGIDGSVEKAIGFARDITADILVFDTLVGRQDWYEALFQKSYNMQMLVNAENRSIADTNLAFINYCGYSIDELRGMDFSDMFHTAAEAEWFWQNSYKFIGPDRYKLKDKRKNVKDTLISASKITFGKTVYLYVIITDLSSEIYFEKELNNITTLHKAILESLNEGVIGLDEGGRIFFVNNFAMNLLGYSYDDLVGHDHHSTIHYKDLNGMIDHADCPVLKAIKHEEQLINFRDYFVKNDSSTVPVEMTLSQLRYLDNEKKCIIVFRDISAELENEKNMIKQIDENKILLQELHHRVKNNFQIICSLISLQIDSVENSETVSPLQDSIARIKSMALIHELLYQTNELSSLSLKQYIERLVLDLQSMIIGSDEIQIETDMDDADINLDYAVSCGLIVTELFTNAIKHAFKDKEGEKKIRVQLKNIDNKCCLCVSDNGKGLPDNGSQDKTRSTLGFTVIQSLTRQIGGELNMTNENGLKVCIAFSRPLIEKS